MATVYHRLAIPIHGVQLQGECVAAGLPITDVYVTGGLIGFVASRDLTAQEQDTLTSTLAAHVPPAPLTPKQAAKAEAKRAFASVDNPTRVAARNADRALFRSLVQTRQKINEVIAWINANGGSITPLANRTFAQAMQGAQALVDAEADPAGD